MLKTLPLEFQKILLVLFYNMQKKSNRDVPHICPYKNGDEGHIRRKIYIGFSVTQHYIYLASNMQTILLQWRQVSLPKTYAVNSHVCIPFNHKLHIHGGLGEDPDSLYHIEPSFSTPFFSHLHSTMKFLYRIWESRF